MVADFVHPGLQTLPSGGRETIQGHRHLAQFRAGPADDLKNRGVLGVKVGPVNDSFVVEHAVAQIADSFPAGIQFTQIALRAWGVGECRTGKGMTQSGLGMALVEEPGPKAEMEFGHHAAGSNRLAGIMQFPARIADLVLLPLGQADDDIILGGHLETCGQKTMKGVAQGDFSHLQGRIEAFAQGHVPKVAGQSGNRGNAILTVGIQPLRGNHALQILEKRRIHA